ncbi:MAG: hypothetical protein ACM3SW_10995 [Actinomycetota bacterium]
MARIIKFEVPVNYQRKARWAPAWDRGRLIQFPGPFTRKPATNSQNPKWSWMKIAQAIGDVPILRQMPPM